MRVELFFVEVAVCDRALRYQQKTGKAEQSFAAGQTRRGKFSSSLSPGKRRGPAVVLEQCRAVADEEIEMCADHTRQL